MKDAVDWFLFEVIPLAVFWGLVFLGLTVLFLLFLAWILGMI